MLDDKTLRTAIAHEKPLTTAECEQLLDSPLTLRRFKMLDAEQRNSVAGWHSSNGLLLAAESEQPLPSLSTVDGLWQLHFLLGRGDELRVTLKCVGDDSLLNSLVESERVIDALDCAGNLICSGVLDDEGELDARWTFEELPREYFQQVGGRFQVRLSQG